jgi:hypothetical protein
MNWWGGGYRTRIPSEGRRPLPLIALPLDVPASLASALNYSYQFSCRRAGNKKAAQGGFPYVFDSIGRGEMIRTSDPLHPMQVRYQAALRPDEVVDYSRAGAVFATAWPRRKPQSGR